MSETRVEEDVRRALEAAPSGVVTAYLYGSRARGTDRPGSDLDLAILLDRTPPATLRSVARHVEDAVERALRITTRVVTLNTSAPDLTHRVLRDLAGFRNVLVHGYQDVDLGILEDVVENHLDDLLAFVAAIRASKGFGTAG